MSWTVGPFVGGCAISHACGRHRRRVGGEILIVEFWSSSKGPVTLLMNHQRPGWWAEF